MILENASLSIKSVIRNIDDDLLQPLGKALFYWNQEHNSEKVPKGDFDCVATGVRSYTKQEVKVQRVQTLLQFAANPMLAPYIKPQVLLREMVKGMDLDPNKFLNNPDEAMIAAEIIAAAQGGQGGQSMGEIADPVSTQGTSGLQGTGAGNQGGFNGPTPGQSPSDATG